MPNHDGAVLDTEGAADYLNDTPRHVRRLKAEGQLPYVKVGRKVRFLKRDLDAFLEARRVEPWAEHPLLARRRPAAGVTLGMPPRRSRRTGGSGAA